MPRDKSSKTESKPYTRPAKREPSASDSSESEFKHTPKPKPSKSGSVKREPKEPKDSSVNRPWTGADYLALLDHILEHGTSKANLADAVPGRTKSQAYDAWRRRALPCIRTALMAKGNKESK
ncbi:uncharacterized protein EHS24_009217 [Apiotrichum porosum]|uniref:Myb-like domain-containing protein n=1 Tax=Apiotrichum porosum TaxID=105984 RepID=A0A427XP73_9TREE|nr:uncharacterized protein EHS24_009217 [Apiotrichum porosum]RSH80633.1 hypothetical protein EHS24_009217 [Apiotrichum porosum]